MTGEDRYIPGVPCWVDATYPDPRAAADFYSGLFGWDCVNSMPEGAPGYYFTASIDGRLAAAISSMADGSPPVPAWTTYIWVDNADESAAKATAAGGTIVSEPMDIFDAGRMAMIADTEGATLGLWQPVRHRGAEAINEHGGVNFNDLHTRDVEQAKAFYGSLFGWSAFDMGGGNAAWAMPAYGDFLEARTPGQRAMMAEMGAPTGFQDVVATIVAIDDNDTEAPAHWGVTFAVNDTDETARRAVELGGTVVSEPVDAPWTRMATIRDPQGATFVASQFKPENKDLEVG